MFLRFSPIRSADRLSLMRQTNSRRGPIGSDRRNSSTDAHCALTIDALPRFAARAICFTLVPILPSS